jgi:XTP/dITP diphosphohydrolase
MQLLIGTANPGKLREYSVLLSHLPLRLIGTRDAGLEDVDVDEPYPTYDENALHKAQFYANAAGLPALADDSGLEVDALDGRPGVFSKRYGAGSDSDRYTKLLAEMETIPDEQRTARFICVAALAFPESDGRAAILTRGMCEGRIAQQPTEGGTVGFGYDFVFVPDGYDVALSALSMAVKNQLSHRGNAIKAMIPHLEDILGTTI